jgi:hypothetical protein
LRFESGVLASNGAELRQPGSAVRVRLGAFSVVTQRGSLVLLPVNLALAGEQPARESPFRLEGRLRPHGDGAFEVSFAGQTTRVQQFLRFASALGWFSFPGWMLDGAASLRIRWRGTSVPFAAGVQGQADVRNLRAAAPFLSEPALLTSGRLDFTHAGFRFELRSAEALGARWSGTLERKDSALPWEFSLAADRLEVSEVARWLRTERGTLLERITPGATSVPATAPINARGRLEIGQVWLRPLELRRLRAQVELRRENFWQLRLSNGQAGFLGGTASGSLVASGEGEPSYRFEGQFAGVSLAALSATTQTLAGRFAGVASASLELASRGGSRDDLLQSLTGTGEIEVRAGELRGLDLFAWFRGTPPARPDSRGRAMPFQFASGGFQIASRTLTLERIRVTGPSLEAELSGTVDFQQALQLRARELPRTLASGVPSAAGDGGRAIRITGTLAAPQISVLEETGAAPREAPRPPAR